MANAPQSVFFIAFILKGRASQLLPRCRAEQKELAVEAIKTFFKKRNKEVRDTLANAQCEICESSIITEKFILYDINCEA